MEEAVRETAADQGRRLAAAFVVKAGPQGVTSVPVGDDSGLGRTAEVLAQHGYEPRTTEDQIRLANCPFDRLATEHTELVCGMNLALIDGVIDGLGVPAVSAELAPEAGLCCVKVSKRRTSP